MVLIKRRGPLSSVSTTPSHKFALRLPSGDGRISPTDPRTPHTVSPESGTARTFSFDKTKNQSISKDNLNIPGWLKKTVVGLVLVSWITGAYNNYRANSTLKDMEYQHQLSRIHHEEALQMLKDAENSRQAMQKQVQQLQHTQKVLQHEQRVKAEMADAGATEMEPAIVNFLEQRQKTLKGRVETLQSYIQLESKRDVIEKFGLGPYRVAITIEFTKTTKNQETFILEMASLEYMPHSVQVFLEQVSSRLWDNTIFWSRPGSNHIITSATTNHFSGDSKIHHFQALGLDGVSFAEYSHKFPHKHYTVGFAGRGPTFYINTMDNIAIHGPGGQDHHDLPDSADPCFAKIVEGFDVVERMHALSVAQDAQGGNASTGQESLREYQLARIVTARILS